MASTRRRSARRRVPYKKPKRYIIPLDNILWFIDPENLRFATDRKGESHLIGVKRRPNRNELPWRCA